LAAKEFTNQKIVVNAHVLCVGIPYLVCKVWPSTWNVDEEMSTFFLPGAEIRPQCFLGEMVSAT